ncbi:MAG TPA: DUF1256 domain-containing protein [Limnochordia bacterium]
MQRIDGMDWTADFRLARALSEAYEASGKKAFVFYCLGAPDDPADSLGPRVADELKKYFPHVVGTSDAPADAAHDPIHWAHVQERYPDAFVITVEAAWGPQDAVGRIEVTDRPSPRGGAAGRADLAVVATVGAAGTVDPNTVRKLADAIIDGALRFLDKTGHRPL